MQPVVITDVVTEPVSLPLAKAELKFDDADTSQDALLLLNLKAARELCETYCEKSFAPKILEIKWPYRTYISESSLPYGPVTEIISITDADGQAVNQLEFAGTTYYTEYLKGMSINRDYAINEYNPWLNATYTFRYKAGYAVCPTLAQKAILQTFVELYQNRGNTVIGTIIAELPLSAKTMLNPLRERVLF